MGRRAYRPVEQRTAGVLTLNAGTFDVTTHAGGHPYNTWDGMRGRNRMPTIGRKKSTATASKHHSTSRGAAPGGGVARAGHSQAGSRFSDGLENPSAAPQNAFYDADYHTDTGTLAFCMELPDNPVNLVCPCPCPFPCP